jgi:hypothetical protein
MRTGVERAGVSLKGTGGVTRTQKHRVAHGPCIARMTSVNVSERVNELTDGTVRSLNATTGAEMGSYRESRLDRPPVRKTSLTPSASTHYNPF